MVVAAVFFLALASGAQTDTATLPSRAISLPSHAFPAETPSQQIAALERWTREYDEWKVWFVKWRGRIEPGLFSAKPRRQPPEPPPWLGDACTSSIHESGAMAEACRAWREWLHDYDGVGLLTQQAARTQQQQETVEKTMWWEHVHVDGFWPMTQSGTSAFGVAGMHTTLYVTKRLQVFLTPGLILMRLPAVDGGRTWSAGTDWGFSYRLVDFRMPGLDRPSTLHVNMARVWLLGGNAVTMPGELYLAGFSITFKQR